MTKTQPFSGIGLIALERQEQIYRHGFSIVNDQRYYSFDVFRKAAVAILESDIRKWLSNDMPEAIYRKIMLKDKVGQVAVAASLLAAEIDFINYKAVGQNESIEQEIFGLAELAKVPAIEYMRILQPANAEGSVEFNTIVRQDIINNLQKLLSDMIHQTPSGDNRETLTSVAILLGTIKSTHPDNTVKSEQVQDLYACYQADLSDAVTTVENSVPFTFEQWLDSKGYIDSSPVGLLLPKDRITRAKDAYKGRGYVEQPNTYTAERIQENYGGC
jgi:hypothetical protein